MEFIKNIYLTESQQTAEKEVKHAINVINKIYSEWKKISGRRTNAVDLITTSANKIATLDPETIRHVHDAGRLKLAIILMRCMDIPPWKPISTKEKVWKKLYPHIRAMENVDPNTGTNGKLKEVILTRLSTAIYTQDKQGNGAFAAYEPRLPTDYLRYLFGTDKPERTYRMLALSLPEDFESLVEILQINHEKAKERFAKEKSTLSAPTKDK